MKSIPYNKEILKDFNRDDFAEIYLFFDYDGHSTLASDDKLEEMIEMFNEETDLGKLYISYPMVESIKHYSEGMDFKILKVPAKNNVKYKNLVSEEANKIYLQFSKYTLEIWQLLLRIHLSKMNYIVNDNYTLPETSFSQSEIFINQRKKYIDIDSTVAVLSGFPLFILDYFGISKLSEIIE